jgi:hypothetical protein
MLFAAIALYRLDRTLKPGGSQNTTWKSDLHAGFCVYLIYGTWTIGIILVPAIILMYLCHPKGHGRSFLIDLVSAGMLIALQKFLIPGTGSYFDQLPRSIPDFLRILKILLNNYLILTLQLVPVDSDQWQKITFLFVFILFLVGVYSRLKKAVSSFDLFFMAYFAALLIWPSYQGYRFLLPIIPIYFLIMTEGLSAILDRLARSEILRNALFTLFAGLIAFSYTYSYQGVFPRPVSVMEQRSTRDLFTYVD